MSERILIIITGRYPWASINSYYAILYKKKYFPEKIIIVSEEEYSVHLNMINECFNKINDVFDISASIETVEVPSADYSLIKNRFLQMVHKFKDENSSVALDITGGRKAVIAAILATMKLSIASNVFYLAVTEEGKKPTPYLWIPLKSMEIKDFLED